MKYVFLKISVLAAIGNVSGMQNYREGARMAGMTADDCNKLQGIQNSLNRLLIQSKANKPSYLKPIVEGQSSTSNNPKPVIQTQLGKLSKLKCGFF